MVHEGRYLMQIHRSNDLSQDDFDDFFAQSKGTIAKALKKLEDNGYVEKNPGNQHKKIYIKTTKKVKISYYLK
ncbi:helix-turn-helix domain-containing protein [uncultured Methanobrevibacter sp.]|uniref:MarR family transcriptional regulator n=1 Tax=uncultured Methanobrevibacter sp. TaxID=253161 RepID=UPI0025DEB5A1|nr:helix-turn-helix domain-containing protein [uncultured Methanobrevibacter sp.]